VLDDHDRSPDDPGSLVQEALDHLKSSSRQREGAAVDHLAYAGNEEISSAGDVAAEDDYRGVDEAYCPSQHLAEFAAGLSDEADRLGISLTHQADNIAAVARRPTQRSQLPSQRPTPGDSLDTPDLAAAAQDIGPSDRDVAEVSGGAISPAVDLAIEDESATDPGSHLDEEKRGVIAPVGPVLAETHEIRVVVDQNRCAISGLEARWDNMPVPAGEDWGSNDSARRVLNGRRNADADTSNSRSINAPSREHFLEALLEPRDDVIGTGGDVLVDCDLGEWSRP